MKCLKTVLICLVILWALSGCGREPVQTCAPATAPEIQPDPQPAGERTVVYKDAARYFLMPVEKHSWPREHPPQCVLLHFTSAVVLDRDDPYNMDLIRQNFLNYDLSIHYIVDRDGTVYCYIPENRSAWHAGPGIWRGHPEQTDKLNHYSIGIEIVAIGSQKDMEPYFTGAEYRKIDPTLIGYTDAQYDALQKLVADICTRYDIPMTREYVLGHQDYSSTKTDPGELFDWSRILPTEE